ncbi:FHA domain-containing protein [Microtetraspora niveoalba]|uniref:FHA domain-containing protein n=1 Tax=Microtetraspora niveoalba TaxID=46175 RepID=UPI00083240BA|nr:FHA domain-containing protein [Microtetraspora niveoalba]
MTEQGVGVVRPLPGEGVVAHLNGLLLVCGAEDQPVEDLLAALRETAASGGDGRALARRVAQVLAGTMDRTTGEPVACAIAGPTGGDVAVLVSGAAEATVHGGPDGDVHLAGRDALTWTDRLVRGPVTAIELRLPGAGPSSPYARLDGGVVAGAGVIQDFSEPGGIAFPPPPPPRRQPVPEPAAPPVEPIAAREPVVPPPSSPFAPMEPPFPPVEPHREPGQAPPPPFPRTDPDRDPGPFGRPPSGPSPEPYPAPPSDSLPYPAPPSDPLPYPAPPSDPLPYLAPPADSVPYPAPPAEALPYPPPLADLSGPPSGPISGPISEPISGPVADPVPGHSTGPQPELEQPGGHDDDGSSPHEVSPFEPFFSSSPSGSSASPASSASDEEPGESTQLDSTPSSDPMPMVYGVDCKNDHFNDPRAQFCAVCGVPVPAHVLVPYKGARPSLGVLLLDDGVTLNLDSDYVLGRDPERAPEAQSGEARPAKVTSPDGSVSRRHLRIALDGWDVTLVDLGSVNGTQIQPPGDVNFYDIPPNEVVAIAPGTTVRIGVSRTMRFEPHRTA